MRGRSAGAALLLVLVTLLAGCGAGGPARPAAGKPGELRVIAVGDSITEADSEDFDAGNVGTGSWASYADGGGVDVLGGWAHGGATTTDMLAGVRDQTANGRAPLKADVAVLMAGSNDVDDGGSFTDAAANLRSIVGLLGIDRVVLSTIPPEDGMGSQVQEFNAQLPELAEAEGWQLVDPMTAVRTADSEWLPGMSDDGVHPDDTAARLIGQALRAALTAG